MNRFSKNMKSNNFYHPFQWFWHIPDPSQYWYQGNGSSRNIDTDIWGTQKLSTEDDLGRTFEWHFATEDWVFFEGEAEDQRK